MRVLLSLLPFGAVLDMRKEIDGDLRCVGKLAPGPEARSTTRQRRSPIQLRRVSPVRQKRSSSQFLARSSPEAECYQKRSLPEPEPRVIG